jgi:CRP-like cAMP-binding protein
MGHCHRPAAKPNIHTGFGVPVGAHGEPRMQDLIESPRVASIDLAALRPICRAAHFAPGEVLRRKGQHYNDMYLISAGSVDVDLETSRGTRVVVSEIGSPIGEIGFLHGRAAMATVTARTAVSALAVDDAALVRLEREQPTVAAQLLRRLTDAAEERVSFNLTWQLLDATMRHRARSTFICAAARRCSSRPSGCGTRSIARSLVGNRHMPTTTEKLSPTVL